MKLKPTTKFWVLLAVAGFWLTVWGLCSSCGKSECQLARESGIAEAYPKEYAAKCGCPQE